MRDETLIPSGFLPIFTSHDVEVLLIDHTTLDSNDGDVSLLPPDERDRYRSYQVTTRGRQFSRSRMALRQLLAARCGLSPQDIQFSYGPNGKPALQLDSAGSGHYHFNLSHSRRFTGIAIASHPIGLDIECPLPIELSPMLLEQVLSPRENALADQMSEQQRMDWFYQCWVTKEALLKASGFGITVGMHKIDLGAKPPFPARFPLQHPLLGHELWQVERIAHPELQIVIASSPSHDFS